MSELAKEYNHELGYISLSNLDLGELPEIITVDGKTLSKKSEFHISLGQKFQKELPAQVAHITLYTLQPNAGIGILSVEELQRDSEIVEVPELQRLVS
jgi:hypothetical protein